MKVYMYDEEECKMEEYGEIIENGKIKYLMEYEDHLMYNETAKDGKVKMFNTWLDVISYIQKQPVTIELEAIDWNSIRLKAIDELSMMNLSVYTEALERFKTEKNTNGH